MHVQITTGAQLLYRSYQGHAITATKHDPRPFSVLEGVKTVACMLSQLAQKYAKNKPEIGS